MCILNRHLKLSHLSKQNLKVSLCAYINRVIASCYNYGLHDSLKPQKKVFFSLFQKIGGVLIWHPYLLTEICWGVGAKKRRLENTKGGVNFSSCSSRLQPSAAEFFWPSAEIKSNVFLAKFSQISCRERGDEYPWAYFAFRVDSKFFQPFPARFSHSSLLQPHFFCLKKVPLDVFCIL